MKYSEYAPTDLVEMHKNCINKETNSKYEKHYKNVLEKLLDYRNDDKMLRVWKAMNKRRDGRDFVNRQFMRECISASYYSPGKTQAEKRYEMLTIAKKAKELANLTQRNRWLLWENVGYYLEEDRMGEIISEIKRNPFLYQHNRDIFDGIFNYIGRVDSLFIWDLLAQFALTAEVEAEKPVLVKKPKSDNAPFIYFVRCLTAFTRKTYGTPLRAVVASTASVIFDKKVTEEFVRKNTRNKT